MHSNLLFYGKIQRLCLSAENNWVGFKVNLSLVLSCNLSKVNLYMVFLID